jgi:hypothetical protein
MFILTSKWKFEYENLNVTLFAPFCEQHWRQIFVQQSEILSAGNWLPGLPQGKAKGMVG